MALDDDTTPLSPLAPYPPHPFHNKSRAPEFYGFVAWISTSLLFGLYVVWALLPDKWILWLGIDWYPNREWAILLPAYSIILILLTYFTYWALAIYATPPLNSLNTIIDSKSHIADTVAANPYLGAASPDAIPAMHDMPIALVNDILYGQRPSSHT